MKHNSVIFIACHFIILNNQYNFLTSIFQKIPFFSSFFNFHVIFFGSLGYNGYNASTVVLTC